MAPKDKENKKERRPRFEPLDETKKVPREEANVEMEKFFEKLEEELKDVPKDVVAAGAQKVIDFIKGKMTWAEIFNIGPDMMKQMTELGYVKFQAGRLEEAERFFKVLSVLDSKNAYFRSMLGTILQRQKRFGEAVVQYTDAIDINPNDIVSLVNRGEILLQHGWFKDAELDFEKAISLDPKNENKWANRARSMVKQIKVLRERRKERTKRVEEAKKAVDLKKGKKK